MEEKASWVNPAFARNRQIKRPTVAKAVVGAPEKPFHGPDLGTPCRETKAWALRAIPTSCPNLSPPKEAEDGPVGPKELGVPLEAQVEGVALQDHGFHQAVRRVGYRAQAPAQGLEALVVVGVDPEGLGKEPSYTLFCCILRP